MAASAAAKIRRLSSKRDALDGEEMVLDAKAACIAANRRVGADNTVTGHDYRDWVSAESVANRARRPGLADLARDARVGVDVAERHRCRRLEHRALKGGHFAPVEWNVEPRAPAAEILGELRRGAAQDGLHLRRRVLDPLQPYWFHAAGSLSRQKVSFGDV